MVGWDIDAVRARIAWSISTLSIYDALTSGKHCTRCFSRKWVPRQNTRRRCHFWHIFGRTLLPPRCVWTGYMKGWKTGIPCSCNCHETQNMMLSTWTCMGCLTCTLSSCISVQCYIKPYSLDLGLRKVQWQKPQCYTGNGQKVTATFGSLFPVQCPDCGHCSFGKQNQC